MRFILFFTICLIGNSLFAQVVNIEKKRKEAEEKGLQGSVHLSLTFTKTNTELLQAKNKIQLQYYNGRSTYLFFNELSQVKAENKSYLNDGFAHIRYNYAFRKADFLVTEAFTQYQYNRIKQLKHRFLAGAGPRFRIADTTHFSIFVGPLIMYEHEVLTGDSIVMDYFRMSAYASVVYTLNDKFSISHVTYYQPRLDDFEDYRVSSETQLNLSITDNLVFKVIYNLSYDADPPEGVNDLFYSISNGITFKF